MTTIAMSGIPTPLRATAAVGIAVRTSADPARRLRRDVCPQPVTATGTALPVAGGMSVTPGAVYGTEKQLVMSEAAAQRGFAHLPSGSTAQSPG